MTLSECGVLFGQKATILRSVRQPRIPLIISSKTCIAICGGARWGRLPFLRPEPYKTEVAFSKSFDDHRIQKRPKYYIMHRKHFWMQICNQ